MNDLEILYEDNHIIVVVKPCNILSQSDHTKDKDMLTIIKEYIKNKYNKPGNVYVGLVHRLDRPVSGVMVFAKTSKAASRLSEDIKNDKFSKKYLAVVNNNGLADSGTFVDYLLKCDDGNTIIASKDKGKISILEYEIVEEDEKRALALVLINLKTGRHHQIRVQFASRNCPLYGDQRYGKEDLKQIALHAYELAFIHPVTKENMIFRTLPKNSNSTWSMFDLSKNDKIR